MRQLKWVFLLAALVLSACGQTAATSTVTEQPSALPTTTIPQPTVAQAVSGDLMECQVVSTSPTPDATLVSLFPPVTVDDWVLGDPSGTPSMTIIEYSDFQ